MSLAHAPFPLSFFFFSLLCSYLTTYCLLCRLHAKTAVAVASASTASTRYVLASSPPNSSLAWRCHLRTRHSPCLFFFSRCSVPTLLLSAFFVGYMQRLRWQWHLRARQAQGTCLQAQGTCLQAQGTCLQARHLTPQLAWRCHLRTRHSPCRFFFLSRCSVPTLLLIAFFVG